MKSDIEIKKEGVWDIKELVGIGMSGSVHLPDCKGCSVVWSRKGDYEHVSVSPNKKFAIPTWHDMCTLKAIFFRDDEEAYQIHPKNAQYINMVDNCLHLWRRKDGREL